MNQIELLAAPDHDGLPQAEELLLSMADDLYANSGLKPMSKALFAVSRLLLVVHSRPDSQIKSSEDVIWEYSEARSRLKDSAPTDEYSFERIVLENEDVVLRVLEGLQSVVRLLRGADALGLVFDTLLRGKWEAGEGLGTFLTPQEVVSAIVAMGLETHWRRNEDAPWGLLGDTCGGTGRFLFSIANQLIAKGVSTATLSERLYSFDQSAMATTFCRLNLHFLGLDARCLAVRDSLTAPAVSELTGKFSFIATNPPFGASKYERTAALAEALPEAVLRTLGAGSGDPRYDPAALFVFRNLDLLMDGGVLGIVLPDGIVQSQSFLSALRTYEASRSRHVTIEAAVSLPTVTFALGGTVAKTSFLILSIASVPKSNVPDNSLFLGTPEHVGFRRQGNRRVPDEAGNDLPHIVSCFADRVDGRYATWVPGWRRWDRLGLTLSRESRATQDGLSVADVAAPIREFTTLEASPTDDIHVSILDVDETGLIDIATARENRPVSRVLACKPGDVLVSCMNPRIWRVTMIPRLDRPWSCSPEFLVLRPLAGVDSWMLFLQLHHRDFRRIVQSMAGGTSSSRQRVPKDDVLRLSLPQLPQTGSLLEGLRHRREKYYEQRLAEADAFELLHAEGVVK